MWKEYNETWSHSMNERCIYFGKFVLYYNIWILISKFGKSDIGMFSK